jgi:hypothetical protein
LSQIDELPEDISSTRMTSLPYRDDVFIPPLTAFSQKSTSLSTLSIIRAVSISDLEYLRRLLTHLREPLMPSTAHLFSSPILVNLPDSNGWSPIHHCVSIINPSISVLDVLYLAGADVSLFTTHEQYSPLHVLALSPHMLSTSATQRRTTSPYHFAKHLIKDLRCPLLARDKKNETCIHIAAEKGVCLDLLVAFLDCDSTGQVRELRNSRGQVDQCSCSRYT